MSFIKKNKTLLLAILIFIALFQFLSLKLIKKHQLNVFDKTILFITSPLTAMTTHIHSGMVSTLNTYIYMIGAKKDIVKIKEENAKLKFELRANEELHYENEELKKLLEFKTNAPYKTLTALVIATDSTSFRKTIRINRGTGDGVAIDMPVMNYEGVIGKIIETQKHYADVLLITDLTSSLDIMSSRSREWGIVRGHSDRFVSLDVAYVDKNEDFAVGDTVVTSGLSRIFPKGLPVGIVTKVEDNVTELFKHISVNPYVNFDKLEYVLVVMP